MSRRRRDAPGVERGPGTLICCAWGGSLGGRGAELRLLEGRTCVYVGYTWLGWESTEALLTTLPESRYAELWQLLHQTHFLQIRGLHREVPAEDAGGWNLSLTPPPQSAITVSFLGAAWVPRNLQPLRQWFGEAGSLHRQWLQSPPSAGDPNAQSPPAAGDVDPDDLASRRVVVKAVGEPIQIEKKALRQLFGGEIGEKELHELHVLAGCADRDESRRVSRKCWEGEV